MTQPRLQSKDPFDRPSPGLVKRLAAEARNDAKRRHFQDEGGPNAEQRRDILAAKAKIYEAMSKGDYSALTDRELAESNIDVRKLARQRTDGRSSSVNSKRMAGQITRMWMSQR